MKRIDSSGVDWPRAIDVAEMVASLYRAGWTGGDIKLYVEKAKQENFEMLDDFAGGELSRYKGLPVYPILLEATALRYAMHTTNAGGHLKAVPNVCPHGFRMVACTRCLKGVA